MKIERFLIQGCCGRKQIVFKVDRPISLELLEVLKSNGYTEAPKFAQAGMIYADNKDLIVSGPVGSDKLNVKCKKGDCDLALNELEALLTRTE